MRWWMSVEEENIDIMQPLSYWTIPYVCIDDTRLVCLYNVAFVCIISSLVANIFCHMTYLQSDNLHGITQVRQGKIRSCKFGASILLG